MDYPYVTALPQLQGLLHQIFTSGGLYVLIVWQILIPYIAIVERCDKGLLYASIKISLRNESNLPMDPLSFPRSR